jgi:hypothetical protein
VITAIVLTPVAIQCTVPLADKVIDNDAAVKAPPLERPYFLLQQKLIGVDHDRICCRFYYYHVIR